MNAIKINLIWRVYRNMLRYFDEDFKAPETGNIIIKTNQMWKGRWRLNHTHP